MDLVKNCFEIRDSSVDICRVGTSCLSNVIREGNLRLSLGGSGSRGGSGSLGGDRWCWEFSSTFPIKNTLIVCTGPCGKLLNSSLGGGGGGI
jgi:hypothetical protein